MGALLETNCTGQIHTSCLNDSKVPGFKVVHTLQLLWYVVCTAAAVVCIAAAVVSTAADLVLKILDCARMETSSKTTNLIQPSSVVAFVISEGWNLGATHETIDRRQIHSSCHKVQDIRLWSLTWCTYYCSCCIISLSLSGLLLRPSTPEAKIINQSSWLKTCMESYDERICQRSYFMCLPWLMEGNQPRRSV